MVIDPSGTVIVWYAPFERGVNEEIGKRRGDYASQMERINGQMQDLRDVFAKQHYVHPGFRGSTSIKAVMPILVPATDSYICGDFPTSRDMPGRRCDGRFWH